jgi:transcriptional regulator with XRE-family HTH domain
MKPHKRPSRRVALKPGALRRAREEAGLTISSLADLAAVSYSHLAAVEAGKEGISPPALSRVAQALGVAIPDLREEPANVHEAPPD